MKTARKTQVSPKPKRRAQGSPSRQPAERSTWKRPTKAEIAEQHRWLDEYVPFKTKRPIEGAELEEAIRTGGL